MYYSETLTLTVALFYLIPSLLTVPCPKFINLSLILSLIELFSWTPLYSDQTDPFSRRPLKLEMVVSNDALKTRIEQWLAGVKAQKKK